MARHKRLEGEDALLFNSLVKNDNEDTVVYISNKKYVIRSLDDADGYNEIREEIESDPELKKMIQESKKEIQTGHLFSTEEVIDMIDREEI